MIHLLRKKTTPEELDQMLEALGSYIKLAVDIKEGTVAGGGALHADCEAVLLENGSEQKNIWGAWLPYTKEVTFESLINLRPGQNNMSMEVEDEEIRSAIREIVVNVFSS